MRESLSLSDSLLSKQIAVLATAGHVQARRARHDGRQRVWLALTKPGRRAYAEHVRALQEIVGAADARDTAPASASALGVVPT